MGLIKNLHYTDFQNSSAMFGRAIAHPVRIKLIQALRGRFLTRKEMMQITGLSINAVRDHIIILESAGLLEIAYEGHSLIYSLRESFYEYSLQSLLENKVVEEMPVSDEPKRKLFPLGFFVRAPLNGFNWIVFSITLLQLLLEYHFSETLWLYGGP